MALIHTIVEGVLDEAMAARLIVEAGHIPGTCYGKKGFTYIREKLGAFNQSAVSINYLALVDFMDTKLPCPGAVVANWLPHRRPNMLFRIVVRELESWLLADQKNLSVFLHIDPAKVPQNPEQLPDPKQTLVNLARTSRRKQIRESLVPYSGSSAAIGRLYNSEISRFITYQWSVANACQNAPSLERCYKILQSLT